MKKVLLFLTLALPAFSQSTVQLAPDCYFYATYTISGSAVTAVNGLATSNGRWPQAGYNNKQAGCVVWTLTYWNSGPSGLSLRLDSAPDSSGSAGTWGAFTGSVVTGINPNTSTTNAFTTWSGYNPWISANLTSVTGAGTISVYAYGCRTLTCAQIVTQGGGGATQNVNILSPLTGGSLSTFLGCPNQAEVALSGTGYTQIVAGSGSTVIYVCKLFVTSSSGGNPVVNTFTVGFGTCGGSPTEAMNAAGVTGLDSDFGGALRSGAGGALCVKESTSNSDKVTVTYAQL